MGLDTSYDCWHGSYITFGWWRSLVFSAAYPEENIPEDAQRYEYLYRVDKWPSTDPRRKDPIMSLLLHSDCDGEIPVDELLPLADALEALLPKLVSHKGARGEDWAQKRAETFIRGLREAHAAGEPVDFH